MSLWLQLEPAVAGSQRPLDEVLAAMPWNADGLIAAIAQQHDSGEVLMLAWMNRTALEETLRSGRVCYWSRSRRAPWRCSASTAYCEQVGWKRQRGPISGLMTY